MPKKPVAFILWSAWFVFSPLLTVVEAGDSARNRLISARRLAAKSPDFAFMDYTTILHDYPESREAAEASFAVGEYYFSRKNYDAAAGAFKKFLFRSNGRIEELAGLAFLAKSAELCADKSLRERAEDTLKQRLSSKRFFMLFEDKQVQAWRSPFGRNIVLREFVDRLEVTLNGSPFHTVQLP